MVERKALSNDYNEFTLREIFGMDLIESSWQWDPDYNEKYPSREKLMTLGYGGNICKVCGAPIIIFINAKSENLLPSFNGTRHYCHNMVHFHLGCPRCGFFNDVLELYEPAITPILAELNIKRLKTCMSCQGHHKETTQYSDLVSSEYYAELISHRYNGGGNHMWISFENGKALKNICEKYPLPDEFTVCGKYSKDIYDVGFIETNLNDKDSIETRMALYKWAVSLPKLDDFDLGYIR